MTDYHMLILGGSSNKQLHYIWTVSFRLSETLEHILIMDDAGTRVVICHYQTRCKLFAARTHLVHKQAVMVVVSMVIDEFPLWGASYQSLNPSKPHPTPSCDSSSHWDHRHY